MDTSTLNMDKLAHLAMLELSEPEQNALAADLQNILTFIKALEQLPQAEDWTAPESGCSLREDTVLPCVPGDALLGNAPKVRDGCFTVPRVLGTEEQP